MKMLREGNHPYYKLLAHEVKNINMLEKIVEATAKYITIEEVLNE